eukprot:403346620
MKYFIKAITTNNRDLKSGILFSFEDKAYLFNCPDGFQRMALNQRMKFKAVRYVFLSSLHPNHYGGLPGFFLSSRESSIQTAEDAKAFKIGIVGPEQLQSLLIKGRSFIGSLNYTELYEYGKLNKFMSERFINGQPMLQEFYSQHVQAQQNAEQVQNNQGQEEEKKSYENQEMPNYHTFDDGDLKIIPVRVFSVDQQEVDCYSFICIPKQPPGKFQPKKAIELGLDPRFHFKILTSGQPVTLQNGDIIYPFQVIDNPLPSQSVIFVFIPNVNYLESFLSEENKALFSPFFEENIDSSKNQMHLIYHSIPFEVLMNQNYRNFMAQFGSNIQHVIDCESCNDEIIAKTKGYALTSRHQAVCPSLIPISQPKLRKLAKENKEKLDEFLDGMKYINSQMGLVYNLYPSNSQGIQTNQIITSEEYNNQIEQELRAELRETVKNLISMRKVDDPNFKHETYSLDAEIDGKEPQILFLGTISHGILMDCAEGSYGQIYDHFQDIEKTNEAISKLRVAFITHIHGDHQLGIIKIMTEREKLLNGHDENNKLYIVTPKPMYDYMDEYRKLILKYPEMVVLVPAADLNPEGQFYYDEEEQPHNPKKPNLIGQKSPKLQQTQKQDCPERTYDEVNEMIKNHIPKDERSREMLKVLEQTMNVTHMKSIEANHCTESFACLIESPDFGRILYSGDTKPCQTIQNYAQNVTLLIHEATFDDSLTEDAGIKKHTTMGQAIEIAQKSKAWRTVLTHFSPRYQKIAETDQRHIDSKIMVAFDHMRFKLSYLEWAYMYLDLYQRFFTNEEQIDTFEQSQLKHKKAQTSKQQDQQQKRQKRPDNVNGQNSDQRNDQVMVTDNKCMSLIKNCLAMIFPKVLEGLTHPDQREQLPTRKKKDKKQYHRLTNPNEDDDDDDEDEESKGNHISGNKDTNESNSEDQNQFFNEFQSWRSNQSNKQPQNAQTELQDFKNQKANNKHQNNNNNLLTLSENEIEKQRNMIQDSGNDDLFKDFNKNSQQRKLPAPPQNNRLKNSPPPSQRNHQKVTAESKAPQLTDLFSQLESTLQTQQQNNYSNSSDGIITSDQVNINIGSDGLDHKMSKNQQSNALADIIGGSNKINDKKQDQSDDEFGDDLDLIDINFQIQDNKQNVQVNDDDFDDDFNYDKSGNDGLFKIDQNKAKITQNTNKNEKNAISQSIKQSSSIGLNSNSVFQLQQSKQQSNDFDDDFDYQEGDEKSIVQNQNTGIKTESVPEIQKLSIEKGDYKKFLPTKQEMKKKNYIGDAIIAERNEQDENEDDLLAQQQLLSQNQTNPNKPSYLSKFSKITQLYDESTKEYKTQQKELGIKQEEQAIVMKAKLEMSKIEEYKAKFLQSAFGGVITNQLAASLERITGKHRLSEEQIQVINNQKPNLKIAQKQAEQEKSDDKNKIKQMSNREEINQIQIQAELETAEITNKNGKQSKKKKKKTKKIKLSNTYIDKQISDVQQSIQDQPIQGKQNNHEDDEENIDDIDEQDGNNTLSHMILGKNTIDSQSSNRGVGKFIQNKALQQEEEAVDWDALNKKNQKNKQGNLNEYINDEEEKQDLQKRQHIITYDESITYFSSKADLSPQLREVEQQENQKARNAGFFSNIASCIFISKLQNEQLNNERMLLLSISRLPFNYEVAEHEIMIKSIYKKLMKNEGQCRSIGNHWVDIGFQSSDPKRDIRGAGMLGVLQLLFFVDNFRESSHLILDHSRNQKHEFPLACQMFEYSVITIRLLKDQKINKLCNKEGEVLTSTNFVFCALFLRFITLYIENGFSITKVGELTAQIETEARNKLDSILKQFYKITDKAVVVLIKACYKRQKDIAQQRLKQLASQSQQFEIKKTEYVNPREKQQQQNSSQAKARNYASKDEDSGTTKMSQHNTQTQQNKQKQSSEFSAF